MRTRIVARLFLIASWCAQHAPLGVAYSLAAVAGRLAYYAWPRGRQNTVRNFSHVLPGASRAHVRAVARRSFSNYGRYLVDFLRFPVLDARRAVDLVAADEAFPAFNRGRAHGRGVMIVSLHFGNWDLGAAALVARGCPVTVVVETFANPDLDRLVVASRERLGVQVVRMERAGPSLVRTLRRNEALALLADRPVPGSGVRVPFFGSEVEVPAGPARLAMASGASILPVGFARVSPWSDRVQALAVEPFHAIDTGDADSDARATMAAIFAAFEGFVRAYPDQWYMFRRMWPGASSDSC